MTDCREKTVEELFEDYKLGLAEIKQAVAKVVVLTKAAPQAFHTIKLHQDDLTNVIFGEIDKYLPGYVPSFVVRFIISKVIARVLR